MTSNPSYNSLFAAHPEDLDFHLRAIMEILNAEGGLRISPLCDANGNISPLLGPLMKALQDMDYGIEITQAGDEAHPQANAILRVWAQECALA